MSKLVTIEEYKGFSILKKDENFFIERDSGILSKETTMEDCKEFINELIAKGIIIF